jgi:hypothetical protein
VLKDAGAAALPQNLGTGAPASSQTGGASPGGSWATVVNKKKKGGVEAHDPAAAVVAAGPADPKLAKLMEQCGCTPEQASQALATAGGDVDFATALVASMGDAPSGDTALATEAPAAAEASPPSPVAGTILDDAGLNANWGLWFCCDDSTVRCIRLQDLGSQFAGRESGYMLYYRSRKLSATERAARTSPNCGEPAPFWKEKVLRANAGLEAARERYARLSNSMRVTVLLPAHFAVEGCVLRVGRDGIAHRHSADVRCWCADARWRLAAAMPVAGTLAIIRNEAARLRPNFTIAFFEKRTKTYTALSGGKSVLALHLM